MLPQLGDRRHISAHRGASICSTGCSGAFVAAAFDYEKRNRLAQVGRDAGSMGLRVGRDGLADEVGAAVGAKKRNEKNRTAESIVKCMT